MASPNSRGDSEDTSGLHEFENHLIPTDMGVQNEQIRTKFLPKVVTAGINTYKYIQN